MSHITKIISKHNNDASLYNELSTNFKLIDNKHVVMLRYLEKNYDNDCIRKTRGIIFDKNTKNIICYPLEGKISLHQFKTLVPWNETVIEESIDGTLINMYYYNNKWNYSTRSTLDGECFWNCKQSFKELFIETFKQYKINKSNLNTNFTYSFVLCHPKTRNVSLYKKSRIYHVLTRDLKTNNEINLHIGIPKPKILKLDEINNINCNNYEDIIKYCSKLHFNFEGVMLYSKDRLYRTKIKGKKHVKVKNLRGNHSNIYYTIVHYLKEPSNNKINLLLKYYPEYTDIYSLIIQKLDIIKSELLHIYTEIKKLKNKNFRYHTKYKKAIKQLHEQYIYLIKSYKPAIHKYKPCINDRKIKHYLYKEIHIPYLVYLLQSV
jgi:hypothetical protein